MKINLYVPDDLMAKMDAVPFNRSAVARAAFEAEVARRTGSPDLATQALNALHQLSDLVPVNFGAPVEGYWLAVREIIRPVLAREREELTAARNAEK